MRGGGGGGAAGGWGALAKSHKSQQAGVSHKCFGLCKTVGATEVNHTHLCDTWHSMKGQVGHV